MLVLFTQQAQASLEYSVGPVANADSTLFSPINLNGWRLEPGLQMPKSESHLSLPSTATEEVEVGAGIFKRPEVNKEIHFYYGARMGRTHQKALLARESGAVHPNGYFFTPALGVQLEPTENLSLTFDVGSEYIGHVGSSNQLEWQRSRRTNVTFTYAF